MSYKSFVISLSLLCSITLQQSCIPKKSNIQNLRSKNAKIERDSLYDSVQCSLEPLTLNDIVNIALNRNLDLQVKNLETVIQKIASKSAKTDMLPELMASYNYSKRNNLAGSSSESLDASIPPAPPSISSDKEGENWDYTLTFNLLDFGISYFRAKQEVNRVLIKKFEYQRMQQNLILNIVNQYWSAQVTKKSIRSAQKLLQKLDSHQTALAQVAEKRLISSSKVLENKSEMLELKTRIKDFEREHHAAMTELSRLMGVPPSIKFELVEFECSKPNIDLLSIEHLEDFALMNRPELSSLDIQEQVDKDDIRAATVNMMPGISFFDTRSWSDSRFLLHNYWTTIGARAFWDLLSIPTNYYQSNLSRKHREMTKQERLALSLATLAQVNLTYLVLQDDYENFVLTDETKKVKLKLLEGAQIRNNIGKIDESDVIPYERDALEAEVRMLRAYGMLHNSLEQLNNALGSPLYFSLEDSANTVQFNHKGKASVIDQGFAQ